MYKIYAEVLEDKAREQFEKAMELPFVVKGALMADAHVGYDLPIGGVVATEGVVVPSWVGYDIGCGMTAVKLNIKREEIVERCKCIYNSVYDEVPVGWTCHETEQECELVPETAIIAELFGERAKRQLGTLGGGNHFIEIGYDENEDCWIVVHSGSRGFGHSVATHYMKLGSWLATDSEEGISYKNDLDFVLRYALLNRELMIKRIVKAIDTVIGDVTVDIESFINRNHNHVEFKDGLCIHRKGATHAEEGMMGVIPGNMRDGSFIVRGKGNSESLCSSSHGAGRVLGRRAAKRKLSIDDFSKTMEGIVAKVDESTLDESPYAYKDIFEVMKLQADLVEVISWVCPLVNIKG